LVRRGAFDFKDEDTVNFRSLLQRMMTELVKDKQLKDEERSSKSLSDANEKRDTAKEDRERKKLEALERSKQRQQAKGYFDQRVEANTNAKLAAEQKLKNQIENTFEVTVDEEEEETVKEIDPFRSFTSKSKNKLFIR
jgi:hypothetical protein